MRREYINNCLVALLIVGSAISLLSCKEHTVTTSKVSLETLMSESSDSLTVVVSENGRPSYRFSTPLVEGYTLAREPYREFRKGVKIITYLDDSLSNVDATLRSNYAIYYSKQKLWEVKGDVVVVKHDGKELYTQQLFWNSTTKRIYSNVDTRIVNSQTGDIYTGEGFESDEEMEEWSFRKMKGRMHVDTTPTPADSLSVDEPVDTKRNAEQDVLEDKTQAQVAQPVARHQEPKAQPAATSRRTPQQRRVSAQRVAPQPAASRSKAVETISEEE